MDLLRIAEIFARNNKWVHNYMKKKATHKYFQTGS